jgi:Uma2 family endonuclease
MAAQDKTITPDELLDMPDDGMRREIHDGVLVEMSPSGDIATLLGSNIARILGNFVIEHNLGWVAGADGGFILSDDPYILLSPDASFIEKDRVALLTGKFFKLAPDLAVEVISPSERADDIQEKVETYLKYGTKLVWLIYPKQRQIVVSKQGSDQSSTIRINGTLDGGDVLPGFTLLVSELFAILDKLA